MTQRLSRAIFSGDVDATTGKGSRLVLIADLADGVQIEGLGGGNIGSLPFEVVDDLIGFCKNVLQLKSACIDQAHELTHV